MYGSWKVLRNISEGELLMPVDNCNIFPSPWSVGKKIDISLKAFINLKWGSERESHFDILKRQRDEGNKKTRTGITVTSSLKEYSRISEIGHGWGGGGGRYSSPSLALF